MTVGTLERVELDAQAAFEQWKGRVAGLSGVEAYPGQAALMLHNAQAGLKAVVAERARVGEELPKVNLGELEEIPGIALALGFAAGLVDRSALDRPLTKEELAALTREGYALRGDIMESLRLARRFKLIPEEPLARLEDGKGKIDMAEDLVQGAALCEQFPVIHGKTPLLPEHVARAKVVGTQLQKAFRPEGAREPGLAPEMKQAVETRDRLWTLLRRRYETLRRVGAYLFGLDALDEKVPALLSADRPRQDKGGPVG